MLLRSLFTMTGSSLACGLRAAAVGRARLTAQPISRGFSNRAALLSVLRRPWLAEPPAGPRQRLQLAAPRAYSSEAFAPVWGNQASDIQEVDYDAALANSVRLIGTTGKDVDVKTFEWGKAGSVTLAVDWKKGVTHWYDVEVYGPLAEQALDSVKKGSRVLVEGRLKVDTWNDRTTGAKRSAVKVVASSIKKVRKWQGGGMGRDDQRYQQQPWPQQEEPAAQPAAAQQQQQQQWGAGAGASPAAGAAQQGGQGQASQEELWMQLFQYPGQWSDFRGEKQDGRKSPKFPDFKKKEGGDSLWIESRGTPAWVKTELPNLGM